MGVWTGVEKGLAALGGTFDDMTVRRRQEQLDERQRRIDALHEPILQAQAEDAALTLGEKKRTVGKLRDFDAARMANETSMDTERVSDPQTLPNPNFVPAVPESMKSELSYAGESNEMVPSTPAVGLPETVVPFERPLTPQEKDQRRLTLALKHGMSNEITNIGQLVDVTNKIGAQGADAMTKWATSVIAFRKQFGPEAAKTYATRLGQQYGIKTDGVDFTADGEIMRRAPNGNFYITKADGSVHEFKPNVDSAAHNTIQEHTPDGTMVRTMQYNPATRKYDLPATGWSKVQKQVANLSINQPDVSDENLDHYAEMYNKYGRTALPFSLRNMPKRLADRAAELARAGGKGGADVGLDIARTSADKVSLTAITKGMDLVNAFEKGVDQSITLVDKLSDKFTRTPIPGINKLTQWIQYNTGDPDVKAFKNALQTAMTEYMKVTTAGMGISVQELTQGAQQRAMNLHEISDNPQTFKNAFAIMRQEMGIKKRSMAAQRAEIEARMQGKGPAPDALPPDLPTGTTDNKNGTFTLPNGKVVRPKK